MHRCEPLGVLEHAYCAVVVTLCTILIAMEHKTAYIVAYTPVYVQAYVIAKSVNQQLSRLRIQIKVKSLFPENYSGYLIVFLIAFSVLIRNPYN